MFLTKDQKVRRISFLAQKHEKFIHLHYFAQPYQSETFDCRSYGTKKTSIEVQQTTLCKVKTRLPLGNFWTIMGVPVILWIK